VHEWGTFTSVSGLDGKPMNWVTAGAEPLPPFVYPAALPKNFQCNLVRMETPVIYFYGEPQPVREVRAAMTSGRLTERFPQETQAEIAKMLLQFPSPVSQTFASQIPDGITALSWKNLNLEPATTAGLPSGSPNHYFEARATDSLVIKSTNNEGKTEREKFLFYRGVGNFEPPLKVSLDASNESLLTLASTQSDAIPSAFVLKMDGAGLSWQELKNIGSSTPNAAMEQTVDLAKMATSPGNSNSLPALRLALQAAIEAQGMFPKEASAMIRTWDESWFSGAGLRVLYIVPRKVVDQQVPLTIHPTPGKLERAFVGRMEVLTPGLQREMKQLVAEYPDAAARRQADIRQRWMDLRAPCFSSLGLFLQDKPAASSLLTAPAPVKNLAPVVAPQKK
jgi:hypothetical protein